MKKIVLATLAVLAACRIAAAQPAQNQKRMTPQQRTEQRIERISGFQNAIYCLHTSVDSGATADPVAQVRAFKARFPQIRHIAIAGGIKQHQLAALAQENIDIVIMGSAITKADDITAACQACRKEMQ